VTNAATSGGKRLRGHVLAWHQALPSWYPSLSVAAKKSAMEFHIRETVDRLRGVAYKWDVVNEAIADDTNQYRPFWSELGGIDMIRNCFIWAREADPDAILVYNDYNCTSKTSKADAIYEMVKELKRLGTPIDEVGFQAHESIHYMNDAWFSSMRSNIRRFKAIGVRVSISELDLRIDLYPGSMTQKLNRQAKCFHNMIVVALSDLSACNEVTFWQFSSKYTWIYDFFNVDNSNVPCPWDNNNVPTVSVEAIKRGLRYIVATMNRVRNKETYWLIK
jgi:endo-1,4-beta-xylanase